MMDLCKKLGINQKLEPNLMAEEICKKMSHIESLKSSLSKENKEARDRINLLEN
jgi:hypothetical protein